VSRIEEFAAITTVLSCDTQTARYYGQIKNMLRAKGRPVPENDLWIAAIARQHSLTLVTRDNHFNEIDGLPTVCW
jgi:tRNA(fMet)-specific endonuclease VapC